MIEKPGEVNVVSSKKVQQIFSSKFKSIKEGPMFKDFITLEENSYDPGRASEFQKKLKISDQNFQSQNEAIKGAIELDFLVQDEDEIAEQKESISKALKRDISKTKEDKIEDFWSTTGIRPMVNGGSNDAIQSVL